MTSTQCAKTGSERLRRWVGCLFLLGTFCYSASGNGQTAAGGSPAARAAYDVVSIRPSDPVGRDTDMDSDRQSLTCRGISVAALIVSAYGIRDFQLLGMPKELAAKRFDIAAKALEPQKGPDVSRERLQSLLADRFNLKVHTEERTLPTFELRVEKNGPKFSKAASETDKTSTNLHGSNDRTQLIAKNLHMEELAKILARYVQRDVTDATGLTGSYDLTMNWTQERDLSTPAEGVSIFTALHEQLGLRLVPSRGPVQVYVVDRLGEPAAN